MKYDAEETINSPSPPRHGSIRSILICWRNGEEPAASGEDIRSKKWLVDQPPRRESPGGKQTRGGTHPERDQGRNRRIMDGRGVGVDSRWKERRRLDGGGSGAVVLRHGWGVRNGDYFCVMADGQVRRFLANSNISRW